MQHPDQSQDFLCTLCDEAGFWSCLPAFLCCDVAALQGTFKSVSAFAPIANPMDCPWGHKAFGGYLGQDRESWKEYDATVLMRERGPFPFKILVDQGTGDKFLAGEAAGGREGR